ncbi:MAG TPA: hypothetical protein VGV12_08555 [Gemmatimonadales bacterium]|nr:hypothetical protein [Gemmatimonadales bacterium]
MATKTVMKRGGSSKIRFVMLEADLGDGDLSEITHAISNALRQGQAPQRFISAPVRTESETGGNAAGAVDEVELDTEEVEEIQAAPRSVRARKKFPIPRAVSDLDLASGDMPFETFAKQKGPPTKDLQRYLLVAYWCKKYRGLEPITADHVYTCYKLMAWGTDIRDFAQPLRDLGRFGRGEFTAPNFTINQVGEALVEKMKAK